MIGISGKVWLALGIAAAAAGMAFEASGQPAAGPSSGVNFINTITGAPLNLEDAKPEGRDTPAVKQFMQTGVDPLIGDISCLKTGESLFLTSCSGCHGHLGEGKIGPGLNDNYWTYPANTTDKGLFETIFGGANGQMGPHYEDLSLDEMLQVMAWVRHLYTGPVADAVWLNDDQKKAYKPYQAGEKFPAKPPGACAAEAAKMSEDDASH